MGIGTLTTRGPPRRNQVNLDDEAHDRVRREELAAESALGHREVREEVFVDEPERVAGQPLGQRGEQADQFDER